MARTGRKNNVVSFDTNPPSSMPDWSQETEDRIARRAYEIYDARGRADGRDLDDWLQAEREVRAVNVRAS